MKWPYKLLCLVFLSFQVSYAEKVSLGLIETHLNMMKNLYSQDYYGQSYLEYRFDDFIHLYQTHPQGDKLSFEVAEKLLTELFKAYKPSFEFKKSFWETDNFSLLSFQFQKAYFSYLVKELGKRPSYELIPFLDLLNKKVANEELKKFIEKKFLEEIKPDNRCKFLYLRVFKL